MRTTKKEFKNQVQEHILNGLLDEVEIKSGYGIDVTENDLTKTQLSIVTNEFNSWYGGYEQKRNPNKYEAFKDWLDGLPSCISTEYEYSKVHDTMKNWFEGVGASYKKEEPDSDEYNLYKHLVTREFNTLCSKNNIDF